MKLKRLAIFFALVLVLVVLVGCGKLSDIFGGDDDEETAVEITLSSPSNGDTDQDTASLVLNWTGNGTTYDIYAGTSETSLTKKVNDITTTSYTLTNLDSQTKYYWQVEATKDGTSEKSGIWSFTTKAPSATPTYNLKDSLVAYYPLTVDAKDYSGNGNHGTANGRVTFGSDGATFDGVDDEINFGKSINFQRNKAFTISVVKDEVFPSSSSPHYFLVQRDWNNPYSGMDFRIESGNEKKLGFNLVNHFSNNLIAVKSVNAIDFSTRQHLVLTYSGASKASGVKMYVNAVEQAIAIEINTLTADIKTDLNLKIGTRDGSTWNKPKGKQHTYSIYSKVLSQEEITQLYNNGGNPLK